MSTDRLSAPHIKEQNEQVGNFWNILYTWDIKPLKVECITEKYYSIMKEYWVPKYDYNYWKYLDITQLLYMKSGTKMNDHDRISTYKVATIIIQKARIINLSPSIYIDIDMLGQV